MAYTKPPRCDWLGRVSWLVLRDEAGDLVGSIRTTLDEIQRRLNRRDKMRGLVALGKRYACFLERHWQMGRKLRQGDQFRWLFTVGT